MTDLEPTAEPTLGQLVASVSKDVSTLIHSEIQLAKAELSVSVKSGGIGTALLAVAGVLLFFSVIMVSAAIAHFIAMAGLDLAWGYLIVFGGYVVLALLLVLIGIRRLKKVRGPERAIAQAKATQAALKR